MWIQTNHSPFNSKRLNLYCLFLLKKVSTMNYQLLITFWIVLSENTSSMGTLETHFCIDFQEIVHFLPWWQNVVLSYMLTQCNLMISQFRTICSSFEHNWFQFMFTKGSNISHDFIQQHFRFEFVVALFLIF